MKFSKIHIDAEVTSQKNLKEINLTKKPLGSVVALVGKNGAGKSRVLEYISKYLQYLTPENFSNNNHITEIPEVLKNLAPQVWQNYEQYRTRIKSLTPSQQNSSNGTYNAYRQHSQNVTNLLKRFGRKYIKVVDTDDIKKVKQTMSNGLSFEQILQNTHQAVDVNASKEPTFINEFQEFNNNQVIDYLTNITNGIVLQEFNLYIQHKDTEAFSQNPNLVKDKMSQLDSFKTFSKFQHYLKLFLGKDFSYQSRTNENTLQSVLHYNNQSFKLENFSPGQRTLFAYAVLLFYLDISSETDMKDSIVFIDEPELHLHPEAQIKLIDAMKEITQEKGQLWIATHSVNILSHLSYDEILMVKDDEIILPSRLTPGNSFNELMGLEKHAHELLQFISSVNEWAYSNFMAQCFKNPDVVFNIDKADPQYILFKDFIKKKRNITLLDYGAGKGRMGYTIFEDSELKNRIEYWALEPEKIHHESLEGINGIKKIETSTESIPNDAVDVVLLCNVLHEISPKHWLHIFEEIKRVLKYDGFLIVIEDAHLPKGELAHEYGYLLLNNNQLKKLFHQEDILHLELKNDSYKERITFSAIQKEQLSATPIGINDAIKDLEEYSYKKIKEMRESIANISEARIYANYTQLHINAKFALEDFGISEKKKK